MPKLSFAGENQLGHFGILRISIDVTYLCHRHFGPCFQPFLWNSRTRRELFDKNLKIYFRGNDWRVHLKCHMNIRDHVCPLCSARFSTKGGLGEHIKRHQGEKNYPCPYCDSKFVNKSSLTRHLNTHDHVGR